MPVNRIAIFQGYSPLEGRRKRAPASKVSPAQRQMRKVFAEAATSCRINEPNNYGPCMKREIKAGLKGGQMDLPLPKAKGGKKPAKKKRAA